MTNDRIEFEYIPLSQLIAYPRNPKEHDIGAIHSAINSSVGFASAITIDTTTGYVGAGHGRIEALLQMYNSNPKKPPKRILIGDNGEWLIPVNKVAFADETELQQFLIMDNRISEIGGWDEPALADLLKDLAEAGDGILELTGYDSNDLDDLLKNLEPIAPLEDAEPQVNKADELQKQWQTKRGQVWLVGGVHRVMCGDSTSADDVARLMDGAKADLLVTDPPYGVDYDPQWRKGIHIRHTDTANGTKIVNDDGFIWLDALRVSASFYDVAYVWCASWFIAQTQFCLEELGYITKYLIIWAKDMHVLGRGDYHWRHEPCLYVVKDGCKSNWQGARDQNTVWDIPTINSFKNTDPHGISVDPEKHKQLWGLKGHGNQKPIECMKRPILNNSAIGQKILDLFLGSGTTLIACAQTGRVCYGMEISPAYVAVVLQRAKDVGLECELLS